jgi:hypothetical protein
MKGVALLQGEIIANEWKYTGIFKKSSSPEPHCQIQSNLAQITLGWREIRVCSNKGPGRLQRGDNHKNVKIRWGHLKVLSRTTGPILTRLSTSHQGRGGIKVCSNKRDSSSPSGDNSERVKIHWQYLKISSPEQQAKFNQTWCKLFLGEGN